MNRAFSLVELSIVLVILGLLTGGILAGQSLIRAAELRSYIADTYRYRTAVMSFRDKYFALPGDMTKATTFWGILAGTGSDATCQNTAATAAPTCNGNGDGIILSNTVGYDERFRFFQHLANAGLIEGNYTGKTGDSTSGSFTLIPATNVPSLKGGAYFTVYGLPPGTPYVGAGDFHFTNYPSGNAIEFRAVSLLKPEEQWNIDTKLDDGKPSSGFILGPQSSWTGGVGCTTTDNAATSQYALNTTANVCRFDAVF